MAELEVSVAGIPDRSRPKETPLFKPRVPFEGGRAIRLCLCALVSLVAFSVAAPSTSAEPPTVGAPSSSVGPALLLGDVHAANRGGVDAGSIVEIPIYGLHLTGLDGALLTVDYDELFLSASGVEASPGWVIHDVDLSSPNSIVVDLRATSPLTGESTDAATETVLAHLQFVTREIPQELREEQRVRVPIRIRHDQQARSSVYRLVGGDDVESVLTERADGQLILHLADHVELGSALVSPTAQTFELPLHVTALNSPDVEWMLLTVDYDELFLTALDLDDVQPEITTTENVHTGEVHTRAHYRIPFDATESLLNSPLLALPLRYHGGAAEGSTLSMRVEAVFGTADSDGNDQTVSVTQSYASSVTISSPAFMRGNANASNEDQPLDLADATSILLFVFGGLDDLACRAAADFNSDDSVDVSDGIALLNFLFMAGAPPEAPYERPGWLNTAGADQELGCDQSLPLFEANAPPE